MKKSLCFGCMEYRELDGEQCNCGFEETDYEMAPHHLKLGTILKERYQVGKVLGEGGFGITYVGRDIVLDMKVAVKEFYMSGYVNRNNTHSDLVRASVGDKSELFEKNREKFLTEARVLAKFVNEEGIVGIRDFFQENNTAYIVMDFLTGETLKNYLRAKGKITWRETLNIMSPIIKSLGIIHKHNVVHRDISPDNIMLTEEQKVKLLDFGAAREVSQTDMKSLSVILKPGYAPEEQYRSKGQQGPWTDIYALCATMYFCISGIVPEDAMERMFEDKLLPLCEVEPSCSIAVSNVIARGMAVRQKDRYQSIGELQEDLEKALASADDESVAQSISDTRISPVLEPKTSNEKENVSDQVTVCMYTAEPDNADNSGTTVDENVTVYIGGDRTTDSTTKTSEESQDDVSELKTDTANNVSKGKRKKNSSKKQKRSGKKVGIVFGIIAVFAAIAVIGGVYLYSNRIITPKFTENELWKSVSTGSYLCVLKKDGSQHALTAGVELQYYLDLGWKVENMPEFLEAGKRTDMLKLKADEKSIYYVSLFNPYTTISKTEQCIVTVMRIYVPEISADDKWYFFVQDGAEKIHQQSPISQVVNNVEKTHLFYELFKKQVIIQITPSSTFSETKLFWDNNDEIEQISFSCEKAVLLYYQKLRR